MEFLQQHFDRAMIDLFKNPKLLIEILLGTGAFIMFLIGFIIGRVTKRSK